MTIPTTPPPTLLLLAKSNPATFRTLTIEALMKAGYHGSASAVNRGQWPVGMWSTICAAAVAQDEFRRRSAELAAAARDHLLTLATLEGVRFERQDELDRWVVVGMDGKEVAGEKVVGS